VERASIDGAALLRYVTEILSEITQDWDVGEIVPSSRLGDLVLESISLVYLFGELQQTYQLGDALFSRLRRDKVQLNDLLVADVVQLVAEALSTKQWERALAP
jgi:hypothetical protein